MLAGRGLHASVTRPLASPEFSDAPVEPSNSNHTDDEPFLLPGEDAVRLRNPSIPERDPEGLRHGAGPGVILGVFRFGHYGAGGHPRVWGSSQRLKWVSSITPNLSNGRDDKEMKFWAIILSRKRAIASRTTSVDQSTKNLPEDKNWWNPLQTHAQQLGQTARCRFAMGEGGSPATASEARFTGDPDISGGE